MLITVRVEVENVPFFPLIEIIDILTMQQVKEANVRH